MKLQLISRKNALQQMRQRDTKGKFIPFSCVVCTLNYATNEGGERLCVQKAIYYQQKHVSKKVRTRIPRHDENGTRNIQLIPSGEIRAIHVRLIEKFNGMTVYD